MMLASTSVELKVAWCASCYSRESVAMATVELDVWIASTMRTEVGGLASQSEWTGLQCFSGAALKYEWSGGGGS